MAGSVVDGMGGNVVGGSVGGKGGTVAGASVVGLGILDVPSVAKQTGLPKSLQVCPVKVVVLQNTSEVSVKGSIQGKTSAGQLVLRQQLHWNQDASSHAVAS